ncbi:MAG: segregation/condensation protein A, partial [Clostridia bacterium]|nr:segregation/condensation protein A [Clostridia bacterium]
MAENLTYKIDTFEGPLDLLLTLISKNKMDIKDIKITVIFAQYMEYLDRMKQMDMEIAGEFIVMASELMLIKSRMLLPRIEPEEEDPRARLAQALLEYKRAKEAALYFEEQYSIYSRRFVKDTDEIPADKNEIAPQDAALLKKALLRLFSNKEREDVPPIKNITPIIQKTIVPVSDMIRGVMAQLSGAGTVPFLELFSQASSKSEIVAIFMAVLALIKDGHVMLEKRLEAQAQEVPDGE